MVKKIRSPQMTGVEWPFPGISVFHLMLLVSFQLVGASPRAMPLKKGPAPLRPMCLIGRLSRDRCISHKQNNCQANCVEDLFHLVLLRRAF